MSTNDSTPHEVLETLIARLAGIAQLPQNEVASQLRPPPKADMGDFAFPCFALAKQRKAAPPQIAEQLAAEMLLDPHVQQLFSEVSAAGPFLNFRAKPGILPAAILKKVRAADGTYGHSVAGAGQTVVIDYSSPNIAKPFHIGHLMSTVLGASLTRIFRALGYRVEGVNHLGDWGTQCGYQFLAWRSADPTERERELTERGIDYLSELYVAINRPAKQLNELRGLLLDKNISVEPDRRAKVEAEIAELEPEVERIDTEARDLFRKLEAGDPELRALWERLRTATLEVLQKSYDRLGVSFESHNGEGFYEPMLKPLVDELKQQGVLEESEGAWVIPIADPKAKKKKPPFIVVKSDGATKYETRDLAAALYRKKEYDFAQNLYVVDVRQSDHFAALFKVLAKIGHEWAKDCHHVSYGMMQIKEDGEIKPMSTRGGQMVPLKVVLDLMVEVVRAVVDEKNADLPAEQKAVVSEAVGVGAIVFWIQSRRRNSNIVFDRKEATNPHGDTGPYVQYTHARACSILRRAGQSVPADAELTRLVEPAETEVAKALEKFPEVLAQAAKNHEPSLIATWLLETCRAFNDFYQKHPVLHSDTPPPLRDARLALVDAVRAALKEGLRILGVAAPEEM